MGIQEELMKIKLKTFASLNRTKVNKTYFLKNPKCQNAKKRFVLCENQYERRKTHITHKQMIEIHLYFHIFHIEILQDGIIFRYALRNASFLFVFLFFLFRHYSNFECLQNVVFYCFNFETKRYQILSSVFSFHLILKTSIDVINSTWKQKITILT